MALGVDDIEDYFSFLYPHSCPVLMTSGRACLSAIMDLLGLARADHVLLPPFSSHCVINAISRNTTPTPIMSNNTKATIAIHQWGYISQPNFHGVLIEDSVDSLIPMNGDIFPLDGRFEVLSLSKIFGTLCGGVILCQSSKDANQLKKIRKARRSLGHLHFFFRLMSTKYPSLTLNWYDVECQNGFLPKLAIGDIYSKILKLGEIVEDRTAKINLFKSSGISLAKQLPNNRLISCWAIPRSDWPVCVPIGSDSPKHLKVDAKEDGYMKVVPIPIHSQVRFRDIKEFISIISNQKLEGTDIRYA